MDLEEFRRSLSGDAPPAGMSAPLQVLWWAENGSWERAHEMAQDMPDPDGALLHGHLHREEGDLSNAGYWYRRAGSSIPGDSIEVERVRLLRHFLS